MVGTIVVESANYASYCRLTVVDRGIPRNPQKFMHLKISTRMVHSFTPRTQDNAKTHLGAITKWKEWHKVMRWIKIITKYIALTTYQQSSSSLPKALLYLWEWTSRLCSRLHFDFATLFYVNVFGHSIYIDAHSKCLYIQIIPSITSEWTIENI